MAVAGRPDMLQMLINLSQGFDAVFQLILVIFSLVGLLLFGFALIDLYRSGSGTPGSSGKVKSPSSIIWRLIVAVALTSLVFLVNITQYSLAGAPASSGLLVYSGGGATELQKAALMAIFGAFRLAGYVSFGRGWVLLDKHFNGGNEGVSSPIIHILAGTALVYLYEWLTILSGWVGFDVSTILF